MLVTCKTDFVIRYCVANHSLCSCIHDRVCMDYESEINYYYVIYNKLLLCNSANDDIAWCNENNSEWGFCVFFVKNTTCSFKKNN